MKKKTETTGKQVSNAVKVRRHRTKRDTVVITGPLLIPDNFYIKGKESHRRSAQPPISLKLEISEEDLHRLSSFSRGYEDEFYSMFSNFLESADQQSKTGARGKHKGRERAVLHIKIEAGLLYLLFSELCSMPLGESPLFFQKLVDRVAEHREFIEGSGQRYPVMLTAFCLEEYYGPALAKLNLKPFFSEGFSHFFDTYVKPQLPMCEKMFSRALVYKGVTHLKKVGTDQIFPDSPFLAARDDMSPCDAKGNVLNPIPMKRLSEEALKNPPCDDIFRALGLI